MFFVLFFGFIMGCFFTYHYPNLVNAWVEKIEGFLGVKDNK